MGLNLDRDLEIIQIQKLKYDLRCELNPLLGIYLEFSLKYQPQAFLISIGEVGFAFYQYVVFSSIQLNYCTLCGTRWFQNGGAVILSGYIIITQIIVICHQHEILQKIKNLILHTCGACAETFGMNQTTEVLPMNGPQLQINNLVSIYPFI